MSGASLAAILLIAAPTTAVGWILWLRVTGRSVSNAPFETWPQHARTMRATVSIWIAAHLVSLSGFAMLATLPADDRGLGLAGLILLIVSTVFVILEGTHHMTLGIGSAEHYVGTGEMPSVAALAPWASGAFQATFMVTGFAGLGLFGGAVLVSEFLPSWAGWTAVAVGVVGVGSFRFRNRLTWGLLIPAQLALGIALLLE